MVPFIANNNPLAEDFFHPSNRMCRLHPLLLVLSPAGQEQEVARAHKRRCVLIGQTFNKMDMFVDLVFGKINYFYSILFLF